MMTFRLTETESIVTITTSYIEALVLKDDLLKVWIILVSVVNRWLSEQNLQQETKSSSPEDFAAVD